MQIKTITLGNLEKFMVSPFYDGLEVKPLSLARSLSYIKNPNAKDNDVVLFMALVDGQLVGFRTVWADKLVVNGTEHRFAWLSGNWTNSNNRRQGVSKLLLNEVKKEWKNQLLFTNYAPIARKLLLDSGDFKPLISRKGLRVYFMFNGNQLLGERLPWIKKVGVFNKAVDLVINAWLGGKVKKIKAVDSVLEVEEGITKAMQMVMANLPASVFGRNIPAWKWITNYPWVLENYPHLDYPFSYTAQSFKYFSYISKDGQLAILFKLRDGVLEIPYLYASDKINEQLAVEIILGFAKEKKAETLTIFNAQLVKAFSANALAKQLYSREIENHIFATQEIAAQCSGATIQAQDGDGDRVFT
jgi:hypothetical protein